MSARQRGDLLRELCAQLPAASAAEIRSLDPADPLTLVKAYSAIKRHEIILAEDFHRELTATVNALIRSETDPGVCHDLVEAQEPEEAGSAVQVHLLGDVVVIDFTGELDLALIEPLRTMFLTTITPESSQVVVNLENATFMDSIVLGSLISARRRAVELGGWLRLAAPRPNVQNVIHLTGLDQVFEIAESVEAAVGLGASA